MSKLEVLKTMMSSENGGLYAALGTVAVIFGIDRITRSHYKANLKKDFITLAPAEDAKKASQPDPNSEQ